MGGTNSGTLGARVQMRVGCEEWFPSYWGGSCVPPEKKISNLDDFIFQMFDLWFILGSVTTVKELNPG